MLNKAIYKKIFTRDFLLTTAEIWVRPEAKSDKVWTKERQPYWPYIIVERAEGVINAFYDPRGIDWLKQSLIQNIKNSSNFLVGLSAKYKYAYQVLKNVYAKKEFLAKEELIRFLSRAEHFWVWFEALWWVWELTPDEKKGIKIPKEIFTLRENTQEILPEIERLARNSLYRIYPELGGLIEVLTIEEIKKAVTLDLAVLKNRHSGYFYVEDNLIVGRNRAYVENLYDIQFENLMFDAKDGVKGQTAYKGKARGEVKIVYGPKQIFKVNDGDVIVSSMTMPDVLPAMKKASAFVTDEGGVMCHAAIIARELKKPCIIGTKIATKVLCDGDLVEVDAHKGVVKIIKKSR
jgi:phosphohistidine swiveling domain-containing protein